MDKRSKSYKLDGKFSASHETVVHNGTVKHRREITVVLLSVPLHYWTYCIELYFQKGRDPILRIASAPGPVGMRLCTGIRWSHHDGALVGEGGKASRQRGQCPCTHAPA